MFRPVHNLLAKLRDKRARKAAADLPRRGVQKHDDARQALVDRLCGELGRPPLKLMRRG